MLNIYLDDEMEKVDKEVIDDVEIAFRKFRLDCSDLEQKLVQNIEQGRLLDSFRFIDRFGITLSTKFMSTGCKAALVVIHNPDKVVNLKECGFNARDEIVSNIRDGSIIIRYPTMLFNTVEHTSDVDVQIDGYRFTSMNRLNIYFSEERPSTPDMGKPGIEKLQ